MSKTQAKAKPLRPAPPQPTEEELRKQAAIRMAQQHHAMAQTFAANICHSTPLDVLKEQGARDLAAFCNDLADALMDSWYPPKGDAVKPETETEKDA